MIWDKHDQLIPTFTWFNTKTMVASIPTEKVGHHLRAEIGHFEFVVRDEAEAETLKEQLPEHLHQFIIEKKLPY